jgi:hypothetical protein
MRPRALLLVTLTLSLLPPLVLTACGTGPAARSPLKEKLAPLTQHQIEETATQCLTQAGWQPDPFADNIGGARRVRATKKDGATTELYIQPQGMIPRITGGPDAPMTGDPFWDCMKEGPQETTPGEPPPATQKSPAGAASSSEPKPVPSE